MGGQTTSHTLTTTRAVIEDMVCSEIFRERRKITWETMPVRAKRHSFPCLKDKMGF